MRINPVAIIQARTGSTRLPGKVLMRLESRTLLEFVIERCKMSKHLEGIILATTSLPSDDPIQKIGLASGIKVFRGSEQDVLNRYVQAAIKYNAEFIVRITADCPLVDPEIIDNTIEMYRVSPSDYFYIDGYPNGLGAVEIMRLSALKQAMEQTEPTETYYREHVMTYLTDHPELFSVTIRQAPAGLRRPELRLSVDEEKDFELVNIICQNFAPRIDFSSAEIIAFLNKNPRYTAINAHVKQKTY